MSKSIYGETQDSRDLFVYVILTLAVAFTIIALVLGILAFVKAEKNGNVGPTGATGVPFTSTTGIFDFEVPATVFVGTQLILGPQPLQQYIVFDNPQATTIPINVLMPLAASQNGVIYRFFNRTAPAGVLLTTQAQDLITQNFFNPIQEGNVGFVISNGINNWAINI